MLKMLLNYSWAVLSTWAGGGFALVVNRIKAQTYLQSASSWRGKNKKVSVKTIQLIQDFIDEKYSS